ncbi:MAG: PBP1A family penicillin-binding protein [Limnobacter sp.]|nr:PBP1A family penicillin-binding protein [Limnobacter sp.]
MPEKADSTKPAPRPRGRSPFKSALLVLFGLGLAGGLLLVLVLGLIYPKLPSLQSLTDYRPKVPLRVLTSDGVLIGEFGEERRRPVSITQVPLVMQKAILAAEDDGFYEHWGIDLLGVGRALLSNITVGGKSQGASTITMQVARNFFLKREKTWTRKVYEVLLSLKIEANLTKDQILELYINQIYLGQRAYGFASASRIYYGKRLQEVSLAEAAMLAGLPKAPSAYNPIVNPKRATVRQQYVLRRMLSLGYITESQYQSALKEQLVYQGRKGANSFEVEAEYAAEMARQSAIDLYGDEAYTAGITVTTTLVSNEQNAAYRALRKGVMDYELRQYYRGPEGFLELPANAQQAEALISDRISEFPDFGELVSAVVLTASPEKVVVSRGTGEPTTLTGDQIHPAMSWLKETAPSNKRLVRGAVVRILLRENDKPYLTQMPDVEAAFVALNSKNGGIRALVGGFEFRQNKFNHVTQATRQPGSSFKPFVYSAALEKGVTPTTLIADEPIFVAGKNGQPNWSPKNYDAKYDGPMLLKDGLAKSKNMISIRVLQYISPKFAQEWATRFGFSAANVPPYLTMALGAVTTNPLQLASAYSVFANGGYRIKPYLIEEITDASGRIVAQGRPAEAGNEANRVIDARNAFVTTRLLRGVVERGTATKALSLGRTDIAGKTGTTNDSHDAWFAGYNPDIAAVAWMGYDRPRNLGARETGGGLALPIWIGYMQEALYDRPINPQRVPSGVDYVNNDYYYSEYTPGNGVDRIDVRDNSIEGEIPSLFNFLKGLGGLMDAGGDGSAFENETGTGEGSSSRPSQPRQQPVPARRTSPDDGPADDIQRLFGN